MKFQHAICWIRRDLRLSDHRALYEACRVSKQVSVVFVYDETILKKLKDRDDRRVTFIYECLNEIDKKLRDKGSALITVKGDPCVEIPELAAELGVDGVFCNRDYEPAAKERDEFVGDRLKGLGISFQSFKDQVVFERLEITTQAGHPFRVFTPYKNAWLKKVTEEGYREYRPNLKKLSPLKNINKFVKPFDLKSIGFEKASLWIEPGEQEGGKRFRKFLKCVGQYNESRDFPFINGTSGLSVHLRFGTVSIRKLVKGALEQDSKGAQVWLSELIWREFYQMILDRFPRVVEQTFIPKFNQIKWSGGDRFFKAWCIGQTGYPLVDAAMRQFNATGWMHNRLRMVVASFLVKDLLVDWRKGEAYFARFLLDFDLAANNGGWQWCASTGCDAQPWFRIFNPITQSTRFDPDGKFIRANVPELKNFSNKEIHFPSKCRKEAQLKAGCLIGKDYPEPLVDHSTQRLLALDLYKNF
ncbi:MAG: deoxyribodipyrimidine photo-lyase [Candidatus Nitronauta litoralis]|uniref:Deoxyribodipyrimidine photo-lyase n=1 Tax=Candidatus Nitronauta litoralis TaxID=2705533 RepID=A0A7T0FYN9_9BACT|nr:MAG: deoxyribodipyrimidine photo-lyase [Candidatus Nitronauta litoralis]